MHRADSQLGPWVLESSAGEMWRIDAPVTRCLGDRRGAGCWYFCSPLPSPDKCTHVAKVLLDNADEQQRLQLEREAYIAVKLGSISSIGLSGFCLTAPQPRLIYLRSPGLRLDEWLQRQPQCVTRWQWVSVALHLLSSLSVVHRLGYVHGHIRPEHVWVDAECQVQLLGWGLCQPVCGRFAVRDNGDRFDPPELRRSEIEASSALDVYSAAAVINSISSGQLAESPVGKCMQAVDPYDRPTSGELVELFSSYQRELVGDYYNPTVRAA